VTRPAWHALRSRQALHRTGGGTLSPFIPLPRHFSELYNECVRTPCRQCGELPLQPALCLLCGELLCAASDCCRRFGDEEACRHARARHGGACAYLVARRADTLLVQGRKHGWWGSLYLDSHGEEDRGLRRGRPLTLAPHRMAELSALWRSNGVREFLHNCHPPPFPHLLLYREQPNEAGR
jgi:hypothetical protein